MPWKDPSSSSEIKEACEGGHHRSSKGREGKKKGGAAFMREKEGDLAVVVTAAS